MDSHHTEYKTTKSSSGLFDEIDRLVAIGAGISFFLLIIGYYILTLPASIADLLGSEGRDFFKAIITNLLPVIGIFLSTYLVWRRVQLKRIENERQQLIVLIGREIRTNFDFNLSVSSAGVKAIYSKLEVNRLDELARVTRQRVWILSTWLSDFSSLESTLGKASNAGEITLAFLLLDPDCEIAKLRSQAIYPGIDPNVGRDLRTSIEMLKLMANRYGAKIAVRVYDSLPSMQLYIFDETAIVGFYWHQYRSTQQTQIELSNISESDFGRNLEREFKLLWSLAKPWQEAPLVSAADDFPPTAARTHH